MSGEDLDRRLLDLREPHGTDLSAQLQMYALDLKRTLAEARATAHELARTHLETVAALATAVDTRDSTTGGHIYRVANAGALLADVVAPELRDDPQLVYGFLLHDIGKIGVRDAVLNKPGPLTDDEWVEMRAHVTHGIRFVRNVSFLRPALSIIATHHEAIDGSGYPAGLHGRQIPLAARMFAICDAFDAMIHDRPYRVGMSVDRALCILDCSAGTQFDPDLVQAFTGIVDDVVAIPTMPGLPDLVPPRTAEGSAPELGGSALFDLLDEAVIMITPEGVVSDVNATALELLGLAGPPVGMRLEELALRAQAAFADPAEAGAVLGTLEQDLFDDSRSGVLEGTHGRTLTWRSSLLRESGRTVARVLMIRTDRATTHDPVTRAGQLRDRILDDLADAEADGQLPPPPA